MTEPVNSVRFDLDEIEEATSFFVSHGFVVLSGILDHEELQAISFGWEHLVSDASQAVGLNTREFETRFPQNRDLWLKNETFNELLFASGQAQVASSLLQVSGVRLFHDHAILKPSQNSSRIPWHQDSAYWPVDRAGLSLWTPVHDVGIDGGCLIVLDGSHLDGPQTPQDFLVHQDDWQDRDPRLLHVPVKRGETVVLHGLTWHSSRPNISEIDRLAYLTLWIPGTARYLPGHADWHPTSRFIDGKAGDRIDGEYFPLFGQLAANDEGDEVSFPAPDYADGPSMFTASKDIAEQLSWLLGHPVSSLTELIEDKGVTAIADIAVTTGITPAVQRGELIELLDDLALQEKVRKESVARDVYLTNIQRWWNLVGHTLAEVRSNG